MSGTDEVLEQMAYLVDELQAQQAVIDLIPEVIWDARPPGDALTLREMYQQMLERECQTHRDRLGLEPVSIPTGLDVRRMIDAIGDVRRRTVSEVRGLEPDPELAYAITQDDTDALREVGIRLSETSMGSPRVAKG